MTTPSPARYWAAAVAVAGGSLFAVPPVASAEPLPTGCTQADAAGPVTCVYTAGTNELRLPEGVASVTVTAIGGRGGSFGELKGGRAAKVTGTMTLPSGTRALYAVVGGNGAGTITGPDPTGGAGGANGGGGGGTSGADPATNPGAGGGGASDVRIARDDLATRLVVAAGGGGSGSLGQPGGDAGASGQKRYDGSAAQPGTLSAGGARGVFLTGSLIESSGADGALGVGGNGASPRDSRITVAGGGGGGGLYGGGGGSVVGSGAGGSSLTPDGTTVSTTDAAPSVTITYQPPTVAPPTVTPPQPPVCTGSACLPAGLFGSS